MARRRSESPSPDPPLTISTRWVIVAALILGGLALALTGTSWGVFIAAAGIAAFIVLAWRDSRPEGGHIHKDGEYGGF